jgi:DNA-binding transcriptional ArsR family regulator
MSQPSPGIGPAVPAAGRAAAPEPNRAEIEATREQLGRTVDELAARLDVPSRAKERLLRSRDIVVETWRESPPAVLGATAVLVGIAVGIVVWRRNR